MEDISSFTADFILLVSECDFLCWCHAKKLVTTDLIVCYVQYIIRNVYNHLIYTSTYTTCYTIEGWNCLYCQTIVSPGIADILVSQLILLRDIPGCDFLQRKIWRLRPYNTCVPRIFPPTEDISHPMAPHSVVWRSCKRMVSCVDAEKILGTTNLFNSIPSPCTL